MSEEATLDEFTDTEYSEDHIDTPIGRLPADWGVEWLNDVTNINPDGFSEDDWPSETFEYISLSEVSEGEIIESETVPIEEAPSRAQRQIQKGDVLVGTVRPKQVSHSFVTAEHDGKICSSGFGVLRTGPNLNSHYLIQEILSHRFFSQMEAYVAGSGYPAVKISDLKKHRVSIPPLEEQRKIATVLHNVDQAIQTTKKVVEQTNRIKKGLIQQFYSKGYYDHQEWQKVDMQDAYVMTRTEELPDAWDIKKSGDIAEVKTGHTPSTSVEKYWDGEISWVDIHDLTQLEGTIIHRTDDTITEEGLNNSGAKLLPEGTLVVCRTGAIGETAILGKEMATDQDQVTFECDENEVLPRYLMYLFEYATPQLERLSAGSTHDKVQLHFFSDLEIPLPDIDEQRKIVSVIESVDEVSQANKKQLDNFQRVKRGLMQDLLSGTVRTNDANIEVPDEIAQHG